MIRLSELKLPLATLPADPQTQPIEALRTQAALILGIAPSDIATVHVHKRSFDARKPELLTVYIVDLTLHDSAAEAPLLARHATHPHIQPTPDMVWHPPGQAPSGFPSPGNERPVVVGFGPCGIFAALVLAQMGFKPIVLERGKTVRERTKDTWGLWRKKVLHPESNVQFGEGGAGTFSDGKLYSQIKDPRHLGRKVMEEFVQAGAPEEILYAARPHIGTFKLVKVVETLREQIIALGGEIRFQQRVTDVVIEDGGPQGRQLRALKVLDLESGQSYELPATHVVMALGHSSRDTFAMLHQRGVYLEAKPFSVGFRVEHPQGLIDRARWGRHAGHPLLGAADYKLVHHASNGRAVYSFCMCPGGTVVAATSEPERVVTNGMSQYSRNERNANAGIVVGIDPKDYPTQPADFEWALGPDHTWQPPADGGFHPLAGIVLQRQLESRAFVLGGSNYEAPGQLVGDLVAGKASTALGSVEPSYKPGVKMGDLSQALPDYAISAMREAFPAFGRKIKGFDLHDAVLTGVETRTSSPLKITRGETYQSLNTRGLFPAGEGASYAGGILSAGVDGIKVGEAVAQSLLGLQRS
ncbi:NAD(P)/FAD-dependent oxidoreductase [Curvibacter sp. RS43]|uniref:NAD(P)/FAD-dependent oxidoreductase n=1 Tax=Curvibacter microcysteis TaxID=3026419 RepID=UPI00235E9E86|nr:NAD(P)/FAD-dependent oxidoreductase [Curvibacter sp. RS43]MDD0812130.1 NAD(P)/FAD-dependent oxidoreductase [Curvibacter sp. RS43]